MTQLLTRWSHLPVLSVLLVISGLLGLRWLLHRGTPEHRPTGDELVRMSNEEFAALIEAPGITTVTS
jgi:hypothetical protein